MLSIELISFVAYRISSHCGVAIYHNNDVPYERKFINNKSVVFENMTTNMIQLQLPVNI